MQSMTAWACLACVVLSFAQLVASPGVTTTESYEALLQAVKTGRFFVDKTKDESKDVLQQILDKSKYTEGDFKGTTSPVLTKSTDSPLKTKNLKIGFEYFI